MTDSGLGGDGAGERDICAQTLVTTSMFDVIKRELAIAHVVVSGIVDRYLMWEVNRFIELASDVLDLRIHRICNHALRCILQVS